MCDNTIVVHECNDSNFGYAFEHDGMWITNPFVSECGRFEVSDIKSHYNLDDSQVALFTHDCMDHAQYYDNTVDGRRYHGWTCSKCDRLIQTG